ncbi:MAG: hypothetical protein CL489_05180 [Acidobacteria bacterium]|nr:hypothetical protein [Acidobacteriota bacterium]
MNILFLHHLMWRAFQYPFVNKTMQDIQILPQEMFHHLQAQYPTHLLQNYNNSLCRLTPRLPRIHNGVSSKKHLKHLCAVKLVLWKMHRLSNQTFHVLYFLLQNYNISTYLPNQRFHYFGDLSWRVLNSLIR